MIITALPGIPERIGCTRIVKGVAITNPVGDPRLPLAEEKNLRKRLLEKAISALEKKIDRTLIIE